MKRRVVITGMGIISPNGINIHDFWTNCLSGRAIAEPIPKQWLNYSDYHSMAWSPLPEIDFSQYGFGSVEQYQLDKVSLYALVAAFQALENANLPYRLEDERRGTYAVTGIDPDKTGVFIGTGVGGVNTAFSSHSHHILSRPKSELKRLLMESEPKSEIYPEGLAVVGAIESRMAIPKRCNPFTVSMLMPNAPAANIGIKFNVSGPNNTLCAACASGTVAIGHGFYAVQNDLADMAIVGGAEYLYDDNGSIFRGFDMVRALTAGETDLSKANRPFDQKRSGFLFSEGGAGVLVIEEAEHAQNRNAKILAEIVGFAETSDGYNIMIPEEKGAKIKLMYNKLLAKAGLEPHQINYINTHGTGTIHNDLVEANVIEEIFGKKVLVNTTKSLIGHTIGASGAIEAIVTVLSIMNQTSHVCKNLDEPIRDLNFITEVKKYPIKNAITQSFAFGGHNASLILKEWEESIE